MKASALIFVLSVVLVSGAMAVTEDLKQVAIDDGLAWLAQTQVVSGPEGWWPYSNDGTLATTGTAALAFIEEGYLPGDDVVIGGTNYGDVVGRAVTYMFNRATVDSRFGVEYVGYERYAEDYNFDLDYTNDGGNGQALYFNPGMYTRNVYTTGICAPVVFALGQALGKDTVIGMGSPAVSGLTYAQAMQDLVDWFVWGQVEPDRGPYRGGWRYDANYPSADNSTAQWGSLPLLYARAWGLRFPQYVLDELDLWATYIQNPNGGSGYDTPYSYVNISKTGGLLLQFAAIGDPLSSARVQAAIQFIDSRWNTAANGTWYGNLNHAYAQWAVYKALEVYGMTTTVESGGVDILVGRDMPSAPGGFTIGQDWDPLTSLAGDWYSHYCEDLCISQNGDGSWTGYAYWTGALTTGWYINILNARGAPPFTLVEVDYHPRACPNPLVTFDQNGYAKAAILGTQDLDVTTIDPATLVMNGVPAEMWRFEWIAAPFREAGMAECACVEVPNDEYLDLVFQVKIQDLVATLGPVSHNQLVPATVGAVMFEGRFLQGSDCWRIIGPKPIGGLSNGTAIAILTPPNGMNQDISYRVSELGPVRLSVYDVTGRAVTELVNKVQAAGRHETTWNASSRPAGVYFARLETVAETVTQKIVLLR